MKYEDIKYLSIQLPETVLKEKWSGFFNNARKRIEIIMQDESTPYALKRRLEFELISMEYIEKKYTVSQSEGLKLIQESIPDMTAEELEQLRLENKIDWMYLNGEIKFIDSFHKTLLKVYPEMQERANVDVSAEQSYVMGFVTDCYDGDLMKAHIHLKHELLVKPEHIEEGKPLHVHMPIPRNRAGLNNFRLISSEPAYKMISDNSVEQPTIYFEAPAFQGQGFSVEYAVDFQVMYHDMSKVDLNKVEEGAIAEEAKQYLQEEPPHMCFTPYLKELCVSIIDGEANLLLKARKIYDFITKEISYRFVRDYCAIDNISEYCAIERRGDCGLQTLLFITLCRIAGVPAVWESGLSTTPGGIGEHDWVKFYIPSIGWLYADVSNGGDAYKSGALDRWNFYFGNVDPFRLPINSAFQKPFVPPKKHWRFDPYDNQCGEAEYDHKGLKGREFRRIYTVVDIHRQL